MFAKKVQVCYGYLMGMLWLSYGIGSKMTRNRFDIDP